MKTVGPTHKTNDFVAYTIPGGRVPTRSCTLCSDCGGILYFDEDLYCKNCAFPEKLREEIKELLSELS